MRRLRQLRLPDGSSSSSTRTANTATTVSAPNSLPDIALIAPEILAAQTNDTTGGLLRPSSAPAPIRLVGTSSATNVSQVSAVATTNPSPRRGRRRCQQQQQPTINTNRIVSSTNSDSTTTCASSDPGTATTVSSSSESSNVSSPSVSPVHQTITTGSASPRRSVEIYF